jgi:transcriptional regulator with XRE-family HTH domain
MPNRDAFASRLRLERERRGISMDTLASVTNVSPDLWEGLERNDLSRWPSGIFARSFVRSYARAIGLDETDLVDEFCRLFPLADRRGRAIIEAHARIVGHQPKVAFESGALPPGGDRRAQVRRLRARAARPAMAPRTIAAAIDTSTVALIAGGTSYALRIGFYEAAGVLAILYHGVATIALGASAGTLVVLALRQRLPALFDSAARHRAHAWR